MNEVIEVEAAEVETLDASAATALLIPESVNAPRAVSTDHAAPDRSARYKHVNTLEICKALAELGFVIDRAHMSKPHKKGRNGAAPRDPLYAKHQVVLRNPDMGKFDGLTPEILITNAHNGTSSVDVRQGVYRFICGNGMIVGTTFSREVIRHSGRAAQEAIARVMRMSRGTNAWLRQVESWKKIDMDASERREFAKLAAVLRWGDANRFEVEDLLAVRREDDDRGDLWTTFNVIQENAMKGGFQGLASTGRKATARPLREIAKSTAFNADLWNLAEEFAEDHSVITV